MMLLTQVIPELHDDNYIRSISVDINMCITTGLDEPLHIQYMEPVKPLYFNNIT